MCRNPVTVGSEATTLARPAPTTGRARAAVREAVRALAAARSRDREAARTLGRRLRPTRPPMLRAMAATDAPRVLNAAQAAGSKFAGRTGNGGRPRPAQRTCAAAAPARARRTPARAVARAATARPNAVGGGRGG